MAIPGPKELGLGQGFEGSHQKVWLGGAAGSRPATPDAQAGVLRAGQGLDVAGPVCNIFDLGSRPGEYPTFGPFWAYICQSWAPDILARPDPNPTLTQAFR